MPGPPPPPKTDNGDVETGDSGQTGTGEQGATAPKEPKEPKQERDPADKDENLNNRVNGEDKVSRQLMMSLVVLFFITVRWVMFYTSATYESNIQLDEYGDDLTDSAEDSANDNASRNRIAVAGGIFLFCALICHMYYFTYYSDKVKSSGSGDNESGGNDPVGVLCSCLNLNDGLISKFRIVIMVLYIVGIILVYTQFFIYLSILFDEDYSSLNEDNYTSDQDDYLFGVRTLVWAFFFIFPLFFLVVLLQFIFAARLLCIFEWRMFLYSFILTLSLFLYLIYWCGKDFYEWQMDSDSAYEDVEETTFTFTSIFCVLTFLVSLAICIVSGMKLFKMGEFSRPGGDGASDLSYADVYKMWIILALLLFSSMFGFTICVACTGYDFSYMLLWIPVIMILTDILF